MANELGSITPSDVCLPGQMRDESNGSSKLHICIAGLEGVPLSSRPWPFPRGTWLCPYAKETVGI
jgi:hypothetical protein